MFSETVVFGMLSKKSVWFLWWESLFSCRALLFSQVLTHVLLQQPGWKWWYSPGSTWISIQRSFSLNYSYRTYKPELSWLSLLHLQLFVPGNGLHQPRLIFLPKSKRRNTSLLRSKQMSSGERDTEKVIIDAYCAWSTAWDRILSLINERKLN